MNMEIMSPLFVGGMARQPSARHPPAPKAAGRHQNEVGSCHSQCRSVVPCSLAKLDLPTFPQHLQGSSLCYRADTAPQHNPCDLNMLCLPCRLQPTHRTGRWGTGHGRTWTRCWPASTLLRYAGPSRVSVILLLTAMANNCNPGVPACLMTVPDYHAASASPHHG